MVLCKCLRWEKSREPNIRDHVYKLATAANPNHSAAVIKITCNDNFSGLVFSKYTVKAQTATNKHRNVISKTTTYGKQQIFRHLQEDDFARKKEKFFVNSISLSAIMHLSAISSVIKNQTNPSLRARANTLLFQYGQLYQFYWLFDGTTPVASSVTAQMLPRSTVRCYRIQINFWHVKLERRWRY